MANEQVGLGTVNEAIGAVIQRVRTAELPKDREIERARAILMLEGVRHILEAFCLAEKGTDLFFQSPFLGDDK
jgi:hypothetical protein